MSANNGVIIGEFRDGFVVGYVPCVDIFRTIEIKSEHISPRSKQALKEIFRDSKVFSDLNTARNEAKALMKELIQGHKVIQIEYGVSVQKFDTVYEFVNDKAE